MNPPTLFDAQARTTDPDTSHKANPTDRVRIADRVLEIIRAAGWTGATTDEIHNVMAAEGWQHKWGSTSKRVGELAVNHRIELAGERRAESGRMQQAWRVPGYLTGRVS